MWEEKRQYQVTFDMPQVDGEEGQPLDGSEPQTFMRLSHAVNYANALISSGFLNVRIRSEGITVPLNEIL